MTENEVAISRIIDLTYLTTVANNDKSFIAEIIDKVLLQLPGFINQLEEYYETQSLQRLKAVAHKMNTTMMTIGMHEAEKALHEIEENISENKNAETLKPLILRIKSDCQLATPQLIAEMQRLNSVL